VIFPVHPRTRNRIVDMGFAAGPNLLLWEPLSYIEFLGLQQRATVVITDSGGSRKKSRKGTVPQLWDGHAAERIAGVLESQPEDINSIPTVVD
jgi:UDP-N-acetylglucosamine 2-epimerase (non-hydrolysing)